MARLDRVAHISKQSSEPFRSYWKCRSQIERVLGPLDFFRIGDHAAKKKSSSQLSWLSAATQPLRDFAAELRREFLMAGFEAIGSGCEYFPCTGAWYSLMCRFSSSCCCSV